MRGCNTVVINGDLMDFHQMSKFERPPQTRVLNKSLNNGTILAILATQVSISKNCVDGGEP